MVKCLMCGLDVPLGPEGRCFVGHPLPQDAQAAIPTAAPADPPAEPTGEPTAGAAAGRDTTAGAATGRDTTAGAAAGRDATAAPASNGAAGGSFGNFAAGSTLEDSPGSAAAAGSGAAAAPSGGSHPGAWDAARGEGPTGAHTDWDTNGAPAWQGYDPPLTAAFAATFEEAPARRRSSVQAIYDQLSPAEMVSRRALPQPTAPASSTADQPSRAPEAPPQPGPEAPPQPGPEAETHPRRAPEASAAPGAGTSEAPPAVNPAGPDEGPALWERELDRSGLHLGEAIFEPVETVEGPVLGPRAPVSPVAPANAPGGAAPGSGAPHLEGGGVPQPKDPGAEIRQTFSDIESFRASEPDSRLREAAPPPALPRQPPAASQQAWTQIEAPGPRPAGMTVGAVPGAPPGAWLPPDPPLVPHAKAVPLVGGEVVVGPGRSGGAGRRVAALLLATLLAAGGGAWFVLGPGGSTAEAVSYHRAFTEGASHAYALSLGVDATSTVGSISESVEMAISMRLTETYETVEPDGTAIVSYQFDRAVVSANGHTEIMPTDALSLRVRMEPNGSVEVLESQEGFTDSDIGTFANLLSPDALAPRLPDHAVSPGDSWTATYTERFPGADAPLTVTVHNTLLRRGVVAGVETAEIRSRVQAPMNIRLDLAAMLEEAAEQGIDPEDGELPAGAAIRYEGEMSGEFLQTIEAATGRPLATTGESHMDATITMEGIPGPPIRLAVDFTVEFREVAGGSTA